MQIPGRHWVWRGRAGRPPRLGIAILLVLALCSGSVTAVLATPNQQGSATVAVVPADIAKVAGDKFEVNIEISDVKDLGAFELSLRYDPALVQIDKAAIGKFIGDTDRAVLPLGPNINVAEGRLTVGALTTGALPGAQGKGVLVALSCTALRAGQGQLSLETVRLSDTTAKPISATSVDGKVSFTGDVVVPTATPAPVTPTATFAPPPETATAYPTLAAPATAAPKETSVSAPSPTAAATPIPIETLMVIVATETAQVRRTAEASWTATPTTAATSEPAATALPATATSEGAPSAPTLAPPTSDVPTSNETPSTSPAVTPQTPSTETPAVPTSGSGAGLAIGLGVGAVGLGAGGIYLWRRGRKKNT